MEKWKWNYHGGNYDYGSIGNLLDRYRFGSGWRGHRINLNSALNLAIF